MAMHLSYGTCGTLCIVRDRKVSVFSICSYQYAKSQSRQYCNRSATSETLRDQNSYITIAQVAEVLQAVGD